MDAGTISRVPREGRGVAATFTSDRSLEALSVLRKTEQLGTDGTDALVRLLDEMDQRSTARFDQVLAENRNALDEHAARIEKAIAEIKADKTRVWREWTQTITLGLTGLGIVVAVAIAIAKMLAH